MFLPLLAVLLTATPARAEEPGSAEAAPSPVTEPSPASRLENARRAYAQGRPDAAKDQLQDLLGLGTTLPDRVRRDALAYLGDILFSEEGASAAKPFFTQLLNEQPNYVMDPLQHSEAVRAYFEELRPPPTPLDIGIVAPPPVRKRPPPPLLSLAPGGVYYFARGRVGTGVAVAGTQTALLVVNLVLYTEISGMEDIPRGSAEATEWRNLRLATDLAAGAFYVSLVLPPAVELGRWGAADSSVALGVGPGAVSVHGTF